MKHQTSTLEGALLDAAIYNAEHATRYSAKDLKRGAMFAPLHTMWSFCGPIIQRERNEIEFIDASDGTWCAYVNPNASFHCSLQDGKTGPSPLIAAMRAFVASKLGEEVEL